jgi:hypothetical protein
MSHLGSLASPDGMSMQYFLQGIRLEQYTQSIQDHGFETWHDLMDITESDLEQIGVLLGHRRKLQRALRLSSVKENRMYSLMNPTSEQ